MSAPDRLWVSDLPDGINVDGELQALGFAWNQPHGRNPVELLPATPARENAEELAEALRKLNNEVAGLAAFEAEYRAIGGNTNWHCLMQRRDEASSILTKLEKEEGK